ERACSAAVAEECSRRLSQDLKTHGRRHPSLPREACGPERDGRATNRAQVRGKDRPEHSGRATVWEDFGHVREHRRILGRDLRSAPPDWPFLGSVATSDLEFETQ